MRCGLTGLLPSSMSPSVRREEGLQQQREGTLRVHVVFSVFKELSEEVPAAWLGQGVVD